MRLLRIEVDAQAPLAFKYQPPAAAVMLSHWALETADGAKHYDLQIVDKCSPHPGVFTEPLAPATHPRDSVVVFAPTARLPVARIREDRVLLAGAAAYLSKR